MAGPRTLQHAGLNLCWWLCGGFHQGFCQGWTRPTQKKTHKQIIYATVPELSRGFVPAFSRDFLEFCLCISFVPQEEGNTQTILTPTRSRDNSEKLLPCDENILHDTIFFLDLHSALHYIIFITK